MSQGSRLLNVFQSSGCPGTQNLTGEDLDWVWELGQGTEVESFLLHLVQHWESLTSGPEAITLTQQELQEWNELQEKEPENILSGELLEEALKVIR